VFTFGGSLNAFETSRPHNVTHSRLYATPQLHRKCSVYFWGMCSSLFIEVGRGREIDNLRDNSIELGTVIRRKGIFLKRLYSHTPYVEIFKPYCV
jgi:hypothetical protein